MALDETKNFAVVVVSTGYDASATSIVLNTGHGAKLPTPTVGYSLVWWNYTDYKNPSDDPNVEIVRCTGISTDTLTVTRAQEGTSAATHNTVGKTYKMVLGITAKMITDISEEESKLISGNVLGYGAVGDGTTDDSAAIQAAIDAAPAGGLVDGAGGTYLVTTLTLKSNLRFENFRLKTKAGATDMVSPVTIGSNTTSDVTSNVIVRNVHVDGNRINQTDIGMAEDGGRHGFRVVGHVTNLTIEDCSATYCASDGLAIYSGLGGGSFPRAINVTVKDCRFNWNRRHGMSANALNSGLFINCEFNDNGQDLNEVDPLDDGGRGANVAGDLYGNGVDLEGYGVGSNCNNVAFIKVTALRNALGGFLAYDSVGADDEGFLISDGIAIIGSVLDDGTEAGTTAIEFTSTLPHKSIGPIYSNITLLGNELLGKITLRAVDKVTIDGGSILTTTDIGVLDYATLVRVGNVNRGGLLFNAADSTVFYGFTAPSASTDNAIVRFDGATGEKVQDYSATAPTISDDGQTIIMNHAYPRIQFAANNFVGISTGAGWLDFYNAGGSIRMTSGTAIFDIVKDVGPSAVDGTYIALKDNATGYSQFRMKWDAADKQVVFGVDTQFNDCGYILICAASHDSDDYAHAQTTNPTIFIHSNTAAATATDQWLSLAHDATDGVITTGKGKLKLAPQSGAVVIGSSEITAAGLALIDDATAADQLATLGALPTAGGTMSGDITLGENTGVNLDPAGSADEKWSGITIAGTAGATLAVGDLCYLDATATEWLLADADAASTSGSVVLGLCLLAANDGQATKMLLMGTMRSAAFPASIALGAPVYVSTTAGDITATQPSATDDVIRVVGWAVTAEPNTIYFCPSPDYITHT